MPISLVTCTLSFTILQRLERNMKRLSILLALSFGYLASPAQSADTCKVLFVGNSYTYFWNLPQQLNAMAASRNIPLQAYQSTAGGTNLGQHWRSEKKLRSRQIIQEKDFDIIILQDHSMRAIEAPDSLIIFGQKMTDLIKSRNAQPYLYMTWARIWDPYMQKPIQKAYEVLGKETGAIVVPVGLAWEKARQLRPDLPLYDPDGSHPSPLGTYLTACVFFQVLTGESPIGLPQRLATTDKNEEKLYLNIQSEAAALFCQKVAAEVVKTYSN